MSNIKDLPVPKITSSPEFKVSVPHLLQVTGDLGDQLLAAGTEVDELAEAGSSSVRDLRVMSGSLAAHR